jgi:molecular chaperone GrpE
MSENEEKPIEGELNPTKNGENSEASTSQPVAPSQEPPAPPTLEERLSALENEKLELKDRMLRIAADFENWKKRSRKEMADGEAKAREGVLRDFLEVVDNLERASSSFAEGKEGDIVAVKEGVSLVLRQFQSKFERYQVKAVSAKDAIFDPRVHEAISQVPSPGVKPGTVVHELQKGYFIGDRLLRPAMVVVASVASAPETPPAPTSEAPEEEKLPS